MTLQLTENDVCIKQSIQLAKLIHVCFKLVIGGYVHTYIDTIAAYYVNSVIAIYTIL